MTKLFQATLLPHAASAHIEHFRIENSSWLRKLERMNRVHPNHRPECFWEFQHVVFAFHDSTFECICKEFDVRIRRGAIHNMIPEMVRLLERNAPQ